MNYLYTVLLALRLLLTGAEKALLTRHQRPLDVISQRVEEEHMPK